MTAELLYPDDRVEAICTTCGAPFAKPRWALDDGKTACNRCSTTATAYISENDPIVGISGTELVAQRWGGSCFVGTRLYREDRTVDDDPQDRTGSRAPHNHVIEISESEVRTYASRLLEMLPEEVTDTPDPPRRFASGKTRTALYERALSALYRLLEVDADAVDRVYAEAIALSRDRRWHRQYSLVPKDRDACLNRLLGQEECWSEEGGPIRFPTDHASMEERDGRRVFCSQPYHLNWEDVQEIVDVCRQHGLEASISAEWSWYFPGRSILIQVEPPNKT